MTKSHMKSKAMRSTTGSTSRSLAVSRRGSVNDSKWRSGQEVLKGKTYVANLTEGQVLTIVI